MRPTTTGRTMSLFSNPITDVEDDFQISAMIFFFLLVGFDDDWVKARVCGQRDYDRPGQGCTEHEGTHTHSELKYRCVGGEAGRQKSICAPN